MVNSAESLPTTRRLDAILEGASHLAGLPVLVVSTATPQRPVVFVNPAFTELTGLTLDDLRDPADRLRSAAGAAALSTVRSALTEGRASSVLIQLPRTDGGTLWARSVFTPVPGDDGAITHWISVMVDVSAEVERDAVLSAEVEGARRESAALGLVARVSDLIMDLDDPGGLRDIADLLGASVVRWAAFYLDDGGLYHADGVAPDRPSGRRPVSPGPTAGHPRRFAAPYQDPVQRLLDEPAAPVTLDLAKATPGTASGWLAEDLRVRMAHTPAEGAEQVLVLPVPGRHRVLGLLVVVLRPQNGLVGEAHTVLTLTARRVGLAVENVRLYAREHRVAETLQRAMLPEQAEVDGLDVWSYYAPNVVYAQVGGDWYDVVQVAPDVVGVVIGDVVGHDVEAAAAMGQLRSIVRAYAFEVTDPGPVLERVDTLVGGMRIPRSAGLVLTTLTRTRTEGTGCPTWRMAYSRAGHLPALLVRAGAVTLLDGAGGALVGFGNGPRQTAEVDLLPGDVVIFYTDGLIERRARSLRDGLTALQQVAAGATAVDAAGIGEELLARLAEGPEDDVAVVVVRVPDLADGAGVAGNVRSRRWQLPSEPASIARARHAVVRTCAAWELGDPSNAELVVSELVANAVLHGWGRVTLRLHDTGEGLRIEVEDSNPVPPVATEGHPGRIGGFGMRIVERLADWGWRPSRAGKVVWARVRPEGQAHPTQG
ncbi:SpoIIE family protein phosphatase [Cellulomonas sp. NPDC089187]|uniref:ATP-binding SpoIIE family protein phosphatase n=1 Tax=Cellulomonas sp. NPDC089187 TaxID=3154970 RepID=UPI003425DCA7